MNLADLSWGFKGGGGACRSYGPAQSLFYPLNVQLLNLSSIS